jgi:hypothetical protein
MSELDRLKRYVKSPGLWNAGIPHEVQWAIDEIERLRAALEKYADENYNGYNGGPEHARAALEKK